MEHRWAIAAAAPASSASFREWRTVCDNGACCSACGGSDADSPLMARLEAASGARRDRLRPTTRRTR